MVVVVGPSEAVDELSVVVAAVEPGKEVVVAVAVAAVGREHLAADVEDILVVVGQDLGSIAVHSFEFPCLAEGSLEEVAPSPQRQMEQMDLTRKLSLLLLQSSV